MQFKLTRIAAAAGVAMVATTAFADPVSPNRAPANYTSGTTDIYLAGSSAVDLALNKFIANSCLPGSLDIYRTDAAGKTYYLWTCEANGTGSTFALSSGNTKIAIHKNTNSSSDGVGLVANGAAPAAFLQIADLNSNASQCAVSPTVVAATTTIPTYNAYNCGTSAGAAGVGTASVVATFGFSDSEPKQFNTSQATQVTSAYPLTIVFGIPVTKNVRDALQTSQGLPAGDESEANMPSLSSAQINGIYTGRYSTWATAAGITVAADNSVYKIRRSNGSGTTRAFDATFMGDFCTPGLQAIASGTTLATSTITSQCNAAANGGVKSLQAGTSDDVAACLNSFQNNGSVGAIGYLSTDYTPIATGLTPDQYRWIKVDGSSPKLKNVADGRWKDWSEESLNYNTAAGIAGDNLSFYNTIKATSASGALFAEIASNLPQTTSGLWTGGVMGALSGNKNPAGWGLPAGAALTPAGRTDAAILTYPANPLTRSQSGGYNLCSMPFPASGYVAE